MPMDENQKHPPMINLAQYSIEQFLLDAAEQRSDLVEVRWQNRVTAIDAREDGARLTVETPGALACRIAQADCEQAVSAAAI